MSARPTHSGAPRAGWFLVLEGIDGAGKSEQTRRLAATLRARGERVVETREPTDGPWGRRYRAWARGEGHAEPDEILEIFLRDRDEHVRDTILPALAAGSIVVCDRYVASTRAYQSAAGVDPALLAHKLEAHPVPEPDLTLWLRLAVDVALTRLGSADRERFEHAAFLERVDAAYARMALTPIDAQGSVSDVERAILARVDARLAHPRAAAHDSPPPGPPR